MTAQALYDGFARARESLPVAVQLKSPVRSKLKRIELEGKLRRVNLCVQLSNFLRFHHGAAKSRQPLLHDFGYAITHGAVPAVELGGGGGEKAASAKYSAAHESPASTSKAGRMTARMKTARAAATVASCNSSFEPK
jgi:hypothetical protein